jgi:putative addiction module component (TIGR02574 family)
MDRPPEFESLFKLPAEQRLGLAQELWDSVEDEAAPLPIPQWQMDELQRRAANYRAGVSKTLSWDEVKRMLAEN